MHKEGGGRGCGGGLLTPGAPRPMVRKLVPVSHVCMVGTYLCLEKIWKGPGKNDFFFLIMAALYQSVSGTVSCVQCQKCGRKKSEKPE